MLITPWRSIELIFWMLALCQSKSKTMRNLQMPLTCHITGTILCNYGISMETLRALLTVLAWCVWPTLLTCPCHMMTAVTLPQIKVAIAVTELAVFFWLCQVPIPPSLTLVTSFPHISCHTFDTDCAIHDLQTCVICGWWCRIRGFRAVFSSWNQRPIKMHFYELVSQGNLADNAPTVHVNVVYSLVQWNFEKDTKNKAT